MDFFRFFFFPRIFVAFFAPRFFHSVRCFLHHVVVIVVVVSMKNYTVFFFFFIPRSARAPNHEYTPKSVTTPNAFTNTQKKHARIQSVVEKYYQRKKGIEPWHNDEQNKTHSTSEKYKKKKKMNLKMRNEEKKKDKWEGGENTETFGLQAADPKMTMVMLFFVVVVVVGVAIRARRLHLPETRSRHTSAMCQHHEKKLRLNAAWCCAHSAVESIRNERFRWSYSVVCTHRDGMKTNRGSKKKKSNLREKVFCHHLWLGESSCAGIGRSVGRSFVYIQI